MLELRASGQTDAILKESVLRNPLSRPKSDEKGEGQNTRAFLVGRADSIPAASFVRVRNQPTSFWEI